MVLGGRPPGRVGRRRISHERGTRKGPSFAFCGSSGYAVCSPGCRRDYRSRAARYSPTHGPVPATPVRLADRLGPDEAAAAAAESRVAKPSAGGQARQAGPPDLERLGDRAQQRPRRVGQRTIVRRWQGRARGGPPRGRSGTRSRQRASVQHGDVGSRRPWRARGPRAGRGLARRRCGQGRRGPEAETSRMVPGVRATGRVRRLRSGRGVEDLAQGGRLRRPAPQSPGRRCGRGSRRRRVTWNRGCSSRRSATKPSTRSNVRDARASVATRADREGDDRTDRDTRKQLDAPSGPTVANASRSGCATRPRTSTPSGFPRLPVACAR